MPPDIHPLVIVLSYTDSELGQIIYFVQWDTNKYNASRGYINICVLRFFSPGGLLSPCIEAQSGVFEDEKAHGMREVNPSQASVKSCPL